MATLDEAMQPETTDATTDAPENAASGSQQAPDASEAKKKRERKTQPVLTREPGKSMFPISRVQKIIKADKVCPWERPLMSTQLIFVM